MPLTRFASSGNANPVTPTVVLGQRTAARTGKRKWWKRLRWAPALTMGLERPFRAVFPCFEHPTRFVPLSDAHAVVRKVAGDIYHL